MNYFKLVSLCIAFLYGLSLFSQSQLKDSKENYKQAPIERQLVVIESAIKISDSNNATLPTEGTIRWTGVDFEGWTGSRWASFSTSKIIFDIDGNAYNTIAVGNQIWMKENLRTTTYKDGTPIIPASMSADWSAYPDGAYVVYDFDLNYQVPYGNLYNWKAVDNSAGLCPENWRVPNETDFQVLQDYLGGIPAGGEMKEKDSFHWNSNINATNSSGLTALPSGVRLTNGAFQYLGTQAFWWSATIQDSGLAEIYNITNVSSNLTHFGVDIKNGAVVRCIKN